MPLIATVLDPRHPQFTLNITEQFGQFTFGLLLSRQPRVFHEYGPLPQKQKKMPETHQCVPLLT